MLSYWQGFEIDGSDTSFNIVLPEKARIGELGIFFSKLPLFKKVTLQLNGKNYSDPEEIESVLNSESYPEFTIDAVCFYPELLPAALKKEIFSLSESRNMMHEKLDIEEETDKAPDRKNAVNPSVGLSDQTFEMSLEYNSSDRWGNDYQPKGYLVNPDNYVVNMLLPDSAMSFLNCPVSSIYEYFAYVVNSFAARFPEISVDGGLDCAGGFLHGCTYASSLYQYECIVMETLSSDPESVKQLLEQLVKSETVFPCVRKAVKYTSTYFPSEDEATLLNGNHWKPESLSFDKYVAFIANEASPELEDKMKCALFFLTEKNADWQNFAQLTTYPDNGQWVVALYVPYNMRKTIVERMDRSGIKHQ